MSFPCDNAAHRVAFLKQLSAFHRSKVFNPWTYTGEVPNLTPGWFGSLPAGSQLGDSVLKLFYTRLNGGKTLYNDRLPRLFPLATFFKTSHYLSVLGTAILLSAFLYPLIQLGGYTKSERGYCSSHGYIMQQISLDLNNCTVKYYICALRHPLQMVELVTASIVDSAKLGK